MKVCALSQHLPAVPNSNCSDAMTENVQQEDAYEVANFHAEPIFQKPAGQMSNRRVPSSSPRPKTHLQHLRAFTTDHCNLIALGVLLCNTATPLGNYASASLQYNPQSSNPK
jgi:hypothetical protein